VIDSHDLERIFELCFESEFQTILVGGASEPLYRPSESEKVSPYRVIYREDFFARALSSSKFEEAVASGKRHFLAGALPARAGAFCSALSRTRSALPLVGPACSRS